MKPRNFAFVVGAAVLVAFALVSLLPSCGAPDCPCEYPSMDGGADGEAPDWFKVHYSECVHMCDAAERWGADCGHPPMREDCVELLWYRWTAPERCEYAAECYEALHGAVGECPGGPMEEGWNPPTWSGGCPAVTP